MTNVERGGLEAFQRKRIWVLRVLVAASIVALPFLGSAWTGGYWPDLVRVNIIGLGVLATLVAIAGRLWSILYVGAKKSGELVREGPYALTRNPLYLFSTIGAFGAGAASGSLTIGAVFAVVTALVFHFTILREETFLRDRFGAAYDAYCAATPRFMPALRRIGQPREVLVSIPALRRSLADSSAFLLAFPAFGVIRLMQDAGWLPVLAQLY